MFENIIVRNERKSGPRALLCSVNSSTVGADLRLIVASGLVVGALVFSTAWQPDMKLEKE